MNSSELRRKLSGILSEKYNSAEASKLAVLLIHHTFGLTQAKIVAGVEVDESKTEPFLERLLRYEPIEYIFEQAVFLGDNLYVNSNVLIPRPETEELVLLLYGLVKPASIVDIGTGSGCIAKGLAAGFAQAAIEAWDISPKALEVAKKNVPERVVLREIDFLDQVQWPEKLFDLVVSNPPYVTQSDKSQMAANVLDYEPHLALFAPGTDDLIFYRKLAVFAQKHLATGGVMGLEINESKGQQVLTIFREKGFEPTLRKDINGKDRFVTVRKI